MNRHSSKLSLLFSAVIFLVSVIIGCDSSDSGRTDSVLVPLKVGNYWVYSSSENEDYVARSEVVSDTVWGGKKYFKIKRTGTVNGVTGTGVDLMRNTNVAHEFVPYTGGEHLEKYKITFPVVLSGSLVQDRHTLRQEIGNCPTPFERSECYKYTLVQTAGTRSFQVDRYFIRGIGLVRIDYLGLEGTFTLIDYHLE